MRVFVRILVKENENLCNYHKLEHRIFVENDQRDFQLDIGNVRDRLMLHFQLKIENSFHLSKFYLHEKKRYSISRKKITKKTFRN